MRALVVHNPTAGIGRPSRAELLAALRSAGLSLSYCPTGDKAFPECLRESVDIVIAAGGDGTVAKTIRKLPNRNIPIAVLPLGTANNIARSLGIAGTPRELAAGWSLDRTRRLDVGVARGTWGQCDFVEAVGVGSLTKATREVDAISIENVNGTQHGRSMLSKLLAEAQPEQVQMMLDGRDLSGDLLLFEIMNISSIGPELLLAPDADPGDGLLDVVCVRKDQRHEMVEWLRAPDHRPAPVVVERGRQVAIGWTGTPLRVDDKVMTEPEGSCAATVRVEAGVNILVPRKDGGRREQAQARTA